MADLGLGAVFGAINTTFKFSEFVIKLSEVRPENLVFVRTIQKVRVDLEETERLLSNPSIKAVLNNNPQKLMWMKNGIDSTRHALNDIGRYVERVRSESDRDGTIDFATRVRWVLQDHAKLENRRSELAACQQTLTAVLISLNQIEMFMGISAVSGSGNDVPPPSYEASVFDADFRGPNSRRKRRIKVTQDDFKDPEDAKNGGLSSFSLNEVARS
ncbi:hypothetical protein B0O99DRAFT_598140 [Bisporella sp. PMI_857]|nr:hypothetical protein B0O99DRAFT_598140 [Bisporella sp. PMI_857]